MDHYGDELFLSKDYSKDDWRAYLYHYYRFTEIVDQEIGKNTGSSSGQQPGRKTPSLCLPVNMGMGLPRTGGRPSSVFMKKPPRCLSSSVGKATFRKVVSTTTKLVSGMGRNPYTLRLCRDRKPSRIHRKEPPACAGKPVRHPSGISGGRAGR